jgi:hypothetical protein
MPTTQGDLTLFKDPVTQELLHSTIPARLAYVWRDGTPRVVLIWFHWNGTEDVLGTPLTAPKVHALAHNPKVGLTIDSPAWPYKVVQIRGAAHVETVQGVVPEYAAAAQRYVGEAQGRAWVEHVRPLFPRMARIAVRPAWVGILDCETRFPSAIAAAMSGASTTGVLPRKTIRWRSGEGSGLMEVGRMSLPTSVPKRRAGDAPQRPRRTRFRARLTPGVLQQ